MEMNEYGDLSDRPDDNQENVPQPESDLSKAGGPDSWVIPPPAVSAGGETDDALYANPLDRRRDDIDDIFKGFSRDRPEYQTAVDLPPSERQAFCDLIQTVTERIGSEEYDEAGGDWCRTCEIPQGMLARRYGINYEIRLSHIIGGEPQDSEGTKLRTYVLNALRGITEDAFDEKMVTFTPQSDEPGCSVDVEEDAWLDKEGNPSAPTKPLTIKELRLIYQALQDSL